MAAAPAAILGPAAGLHIEIDGDARVGYTAKVMDAGRLVATEGGTTQADMTIATGSATVALRNRYTGFALDPAKGTLRLERVLNAVGEVQVECSESYRLLRTGEIDSHVEVASGGPARMWFSPLVEAAPPYDLGNTDNARQSFAWNSAFVAFQRSLSKDVR